jgi:hypothetical protein
LRFENPEMTPNCRSNARELKLPFVEARQYKNPVVAILPPNIRTDKRTVVLVGVADILVICGRNLTAVGKLVGELVGGMYLLIIEPNRFPAASYETKLRPSRGIS